MNRSIGSVLFDSIYNLISTLGYVAAGGWLIESDHAIALGIILIWGGSYNALDELLKELQDRQNKRNERKTFI